MKKINYVTIVVTIFVLSFNKKGKYVVEEGMFKIIFEYPLFERICLHYIIL
jgi:hypothetical protein